MMSDYRVQRTEDRVGPTGAAACGSRALHLSNPFRPAIAVLGLLCAVLCLASACGNAEQAQAYARAEQAEQRFSLETAPAIIADYRRVIALDPESDWAKKAGTRIQAVEARVRAEETHKEVFQEHGVD